MKRSAPMKRTPFKAKPPEPGARKPLKPKTCAKAKGGCGERFTPSRPLQDACGPLCALAMAARRRERAEARAALEDRKQTRAQLEALKTVPQLKKEAQREFNRWVRQRDARLPCISCDAPPPDLSGLHAGRDAGHYRSTGSADHLRFHPDNCHGQCVKCNQYGAGMAVDYRIGLIRRIGMERVEALEHANELVKWTREMLREIRDTYRLKARALEKGAANDSSMERAA